ncbi:aminopeptidase family protein P [Pararhodospirillum photometricum]|uniref:Peptidase M24 n=1 Tax=Pararhodospirillum photometricum DSM 122 TaxID=1150469 RepID=H6SRW0_PARPM|nr:aminopeptidase family protein P [Pararhodospirillum photometricum]CCG07639.1 Peptidase M24 [Pararhodospirillum photometricum DSM 122]
MILPDQAALFVDGRYTLQAAAQVDAALFTCRHLLDDPAPRWLETVLPPGARLGYDPWQLTPDARERLHRTGDPRGVVLVACPVNPIDLLWADRPAPPASLARPHPTAWAGRDSTAKRAEIAALLQARGQAAVVLASPDSVAWLLNIRGADVPHTPLALARAVLHADASVDLFLAESRVSPLLVEHLGPQVRRHDPEALGGLLDTLGERGKVVRVDRSRTPAWIHDRLEEAGAGLVVAEDPCLLPKACKNATELAGARAAHRRDGLAVTRFLHWLAETAPRGGLTEMAAADALAGFRAQDPSLVDLSFPTISAAGPNAAIVHYRATPATDRLLEPGQIYLVDSGGQYPDGTTDITRTIAIGPAVPGVRRCFTLVLRGHIALARARFPKGTTGSQLDSLARQFLWAEGLDYDHGTGHGVGSFLGVHEGPARLNRTGNGIALVPGMILSNEPGVYRENAFGIRIENLMAVQEITPTPEGATRPFLGFETLTLAPLDRSLIEVGQLRPGERAWVDAYHARVREAHAPHLEASARAWLEAATAPL